MRRSGKVVLVGVALIFVALALDLAGEELQALPILLASFAFAIAGAAVAIRGLVELISER